MKSYVLHVKFYSPLLIQHSPMLDSVVAFCLEHRSNDRQGYITRNLGLDSSSLIFMKPIKDLILHHEDVAVVSELQFDTAIEFTDFSTKRFENKFTNLADFGSARRRVHIQGFWSRSRKTPVRCIVANYAHWYFIGDGQGVLDLLKKHLVGIGKRVDSGWGFISDIELQESDLSMTGILKMRPVPVTIADSIGITGPITLCAYKIPYWDRGSVSECVVPDAKL